MRVDPDLVWLAVGTAVLSAPALMVAVYQAAVLRRGPKPLRVNLSWPRRRRR